MSAIRAPAKPVRAKTRSAARRICASLARRMPPFFGAASGRSLRAEEAVAGIAEPGHDIGVVVEAVIDRRDIDGYRRMLSMDGGDAGRRRDEAHEFDALGAELLQPSDRRRGGVAGRQHRIDENDDALRDVLRKLQIVFDGIEGRGVAVDADMADTRRWDEVEHAVDEAEAGAQDRHEAELLAGEHRRAHAGERRLDLGLGEGQVARRFVEHERRDLAQERAELARRDVLRAHQRQLVLDERMADDDDIFGHFLPLFADQNTVPSLSMRSGGSPSGRFSPAIRRPAAQVPPSSTLASGRRTASRPRRARSAAARRSRSATVSARHSTIASSPTASARRGKSGSRGSMTPRSRKSPPLRYSARPVNASQSVTAIPASSSGSMSE